MAEGNSSDTLSIGGIFKGAFNAIFGSKEEEVAGGYTLPFVDEIPKELICKICSLPSRNTMLNVRCGHIYCKKCVENKRERSYFPTCPLDGSSIEEGNIRFNIMYDVRIGCLRVYCTNRSRGCPSTPILEQLEEHEMRCLYVEVGCPLHCGLMVLNVNMDAHITANCPRGRVKCHGCLITMERRFHDEHKKGCPYVKVKCPLLCGVTPPRMDLNAHMVKDCSESEVECDGCKRKIKRWRLQEHRENCPYIKVMCPLLCGQTLLRLDVIAHATGCPRGEVECDDCRKKMERQNLQMHEKGCLYKKVLCPLWCGLTLLRSGLNAHMAADCPRGEVECDDCRRKIERQSLQRHEKGCLYKKVKCPLLCGLTLLRSGLNAHVAADCPRGEVECDDCRKKKKVPTATLR